MKRHVVIPKYLASTALAIVGAHVTGLIYLVAAKATMGTIAMVTPVHALILALSVAVVAAAAKGVRSAMEHDTIEFDLEERRA